MESESRGSATASAPSPSAGSFLSIHAVRIYVRDLDRSLAFYLDQLGFRLVVDTRIQSGEPTDGVTEAFDEAGDEYGEERFVEALKRHRDRPPQDLLASLLGEVSAFSAREQHDDVTLIVARRRGSSAT